MFRGRHETQDDHVAVRVVVFFELGGVVHLDCVVGSSRVGDGTGPEVGRQDGPEFLGFELSRSLPSSLSC